MTEEFNNWPEIDPSHFSFSELPVDGDIETILKAEAERMIGEHGCEEVRLTIVSDEFPNDGYPHGLYFEGWSLAPNRHDPPGKPAPFNYPMVAM